MSTYPLTANVVTNTHYKIYEEERITIQGNFGILRSLYTSHSAASKSLFVDRGNASINWNYHKSAVSNVKSYDNYYYDSSATTSLTDYANYYKQNFSNDPAFRDKVDYIYTTFRGFTDVYGNATQALSLYQAFFNNTVFLNTIDSAKKYLYALIYTITNRNEINFYNYTESGTTPYFNLSYHFNSNALCNLEYKILYPYYSMYIFSSKKPSTSNGNKTCTFSVPAYHIYLTYSSHYDYKNVQTGVGTKTYQIETASYIENNIT